MMLACCSTCHTVIGKKIVTMTVHLKVTFELSTCCLLNWCFWIWIVKILILKSGICFMRWNFSVDETKNEMMRSDCSVEFDLLQSVLPVHTISLMYIYQYNAMNPVMRWNFSVEFELLQCVLPVHTMSFMYIFTNTMLWILNLSR
jgi:hypothetical protein